ncbi:hypothetical protein CPAST_c33100 [Clostridium pasteurianum DSM 525 = ATCC 6013]|uniref:Uncharacterized protein n=1 Tax=Clostridium pasteurianum DSM 525 = ATCC 6013 TaxID=1262449 RepID=A0A0H3J5T7_CLOPA|nr:hypothetical protein [Clostridium pasteurianum]AJA49376.1 hypothetical protein CPAST_c33100 [Clostridium pasteurianum DSM 525 = ATCC 6013]AJA53364.1 hypothetical protein CLPA_c33100 [Clostridium pasteurianum DSM 525 = ATCC 6013]AOZ76548.1 hypothetical protein AQ983_16080 [Clostridium pasteurianum DSM 525 = ATCC 6013]AOZ80345.1 hypothetical protein AQ984_16075 [Clostridium pasteurianum]ELP58508.1 hypothetical protein F502_14820 [Clostridium pasteurianum DSM 525 = ATCC 6013]
MLKLSALEFFFRTIPESFLIVMVAYIFANKKISRKSFIVASLILAVITYLVRLLPISFGVNTMINMIVFIIIGINIIKININISIISVFISVISIYLCEWINVIILNDLFNIDRFSNDYFKFLLTMPSLFMFAIVVLLFYMFINKFVRR